MHRQPLFDAIWAFTSAKDYDVFLYSRQTTEALELYLATQEAAHLEEYQSLLKRVTLDSWKRRLTKTLGLQVLNGEVHDLEWAEREFHVIRDAVKPDWDQARLPTLSS